MTDSFICDSCKASPDTLYEGWFRSAAALNPFAVGTASAGVIQYKRVCKCCLDAAIKSGLACAKEVP